MTSILIVGNSDETQVSLRDQLQGLNLFSANSIFHLGPPEKVHQLLKPEMDLVIHYSERAEEDLKVFPLMCRRLGYEGPIVILHPKLPEEMKSLSLDGVVFLEPSGTGQFLGGVLRKIIEDEAVSQRKFRRFSLHESVLIEYYEGQGSKYKGTIHNISRGGLYLKGELGVFGPGDLIRIHFDFDEIQKQRSMSARVAWKRGSSNAKPKNVSIGVEFVSQEYVYKYLLKHAL